MKLRELNNRVSIFFILIILYYLFNLITSPLNSGMSGTLLADNNPINQGFAGIILIYSLYFTTVTRRFKLNTNNIIIFFLVYISIRYLFLYLSDARFAISQVNYFFYILLWGSCLSFGLTNFNRIRPELLDKQLRIVIISVIIFFMFKIITQKSILENSGIVAGINAVGSAYFLAPLILLVFNGKNKLMLFILILLLCLFSAKRQALIGGLVVVLINIRLILFNLKKLRWQQIGVIILIISVVLFFGAWSYIEKSYDYLISRHEMIQKNDFSIDSGRSDLRKAAIEGYEESFFVYKLFGGGTGQGGKYIENNNGKFNYPHCGFIEILCDYGIVGLFLYLFFFINMLLHTRNIKQKKILPIYLSLVTIWIIVNIYSHSGGFIYIFLSITYAYLYTTNKLKYFNNIH